LALASVLENIRFARATGQILGFIAAARDYAIREKGFALQPGEDALLVLTRADTITDVTIGESSVTMYNPWHGIVTATVSMPSIVRLETEVPVRDCRRLALFFIKEAGSLGFQAMEAREGATGAWRRFYDGVSIHIPGSRSIEAACGETSRTIVALVFMVR